MTKEELNKEATEYALEWGDKTDGTYACCRDGYLAGAEPREKRIAELEKELEQAKKVQVVEHFEAYGQCRDSRRIASIEKENAELKDKLKNLESVAEVRLANWQKYEKENKELKAEKDCETCVKFDEVKLTKAKEIIRQLCLMVRELNNPNVQLTNVDYSLKEAEQFIKDR